MSEEKAAELKKLIEQVEHAKKLRAVAFLALGLSSLSETISRGGSDTLDVSYIDCDIREGISYLDNNRLRKIVYTLYGHKVKNKIIYITSTALCHLANRYGQTFLALPFAIGDFGLTNLYQTIRKTIVMILLGAVRPLFIIGNPISLMLAFSLTTFGLRLAFSNLDFILTSPISETDSLKNLKPRIPGLPDVIVVNSKKKLVMTNLGQKKTECWLLEQALLNPGCKIKPTNIPNAIDLVSHDLKYQNVVNMQDVTGLDRVDFIDVLDLGQSKRPKAKITNFLEKFGDSGPIDEIDTWNPFVPQKKYLRIRNEL